MLRPGGRLVFAVWRAADQNPWVSLSARVFVDRGLMAPTEAGSPGAFALASDDRVQAVLGGAGFRDVRIDDVPVRHIYDDVDEYVAAARQTMGSFATAFDGASEEEQRAVIDELRVAFAPFATLTGLSFRDSRSSLWRADLEFRGASAGGNRQESARPERVAAKETGTAALACHEAQARGKGDPEGTHGQIVGGGAQRKSRGDQVAPAPFRQKAYAAFSVRSFG